MRITRFDFFVHNTKIGLLTGIEVLIVWPNM